MSSHRGDQPAPGPALRWTRVLVPVATLVCVLVGGMLVGGPDETASVSGAPTSEPPATAETRRSKPLPRQLPAEKQIGKFAQMGVVDRALAREEKARKARIRAIRTMEKNSTFRVSSFNILGHSHTAKGGERKGWAPGTTRVRWVVDLLRAADVSVVGLQEFQPEQASVFHAVAGEYDTYPTSGARESFANSIAWDTGVWTFVEGRTIGIPYFGGRNVEMPLVRLKHQPSGRRVWFANFHNPADAHGPAQHWRDEATRRQIAMANDLTADGSHLVITGDMNDREEYFCPMTASTEMHAADGGSTGTSCAPPSRMNVDWIFGSGKIVWSNYTSDRSATVARTSDHPFVWADAKVLGPKK